MPFIRCQMESVPGLVLCGLRLAHHLYLFPFLFCQGINLPFSQPVFARVLFCRETEAYHWCIFKVYLDIYSYNGIMG